MAVVTKPKASAFELRSAALTLLAFVLKTCDLALLERELEESSADAPELFDGEPVAIDLSALRDEDEAIDFAALVALLKRFRMTPLAVRGGSDRQMKAATPAGLFAAPDGAPARQEAKHPGPVEAAESAPHDGPVDADSARPTLIVDRPLRSGQQIYARGGDLVVMSVVSFGAEVIADGNVHVYAPLRGRAIAGARGNEKARIFATCMEPQLLAIAGTYRTTETELAPDVLGKPAQVRLEGDRLIVEALAINPQPAPPARRAAASMLRLRKDRP